MTIISDTLAAHALRALEGKPPEDSARLDVLAAALDDALVGLSGDLATAQRVRDLEGENAVLLEELRRVRQAILEAGVVAGPDVGTPQLVPLLVEYLAMKDEVDVDVVDEGPADPLDNADALLERCAALARGEVGAGLDARAIRLDTLEQALGEVVVAVRRRPALELGVDPGRYLSSAKTMLDLAHNPQSSDGGPFAGDSTGYRVMHVARALTDVIHLLEQTVGR